ncbi:MAG: hypothetical protein US58_C0012G0060 [Candidatus Magasanikbacteria bacterium GW2011_GWA2_37_8]|uniref:Uncharacterized protein n=1 Tax=Candidatus Magasanikbacteria bacterium GW2011_GWA2_37_8 TaxID=1619036 RepID=A0A0G0KJR4_9BACT|nr:MAG: hypothetical protein US58_C0012G0060 [Candidatus Magasanikbacteria bacterium GW2011_GWA2_37_8]
MGYIVGAAFLLLGVVLVIKTEWFLENFGTIAWAEENLGTSGGSRLLYKLIGLVLIFVGFLLVTNLMQGFLMATIGKLFIRS